MSQNNFLQELYKDDKRRIDDAFESCKRYFEKDMVPAIFACPSLLPPEGHEPDGFHFNDFAIKRRIPTKLFLGLSRSTKPATEEEMRTFIQNNETPARFQAWNKYYWGLR